MRFLSILTIVLLLPVIATPSSESLSPTFICSSPTTEFALGSIDQDTLLLQLTHIYGVQFTPIHKGTVVSYQINELKKQYENLKKLGAVLDTRWNKRFCKKIPQTALSCDRGEEITINGLKVKPVSISVTKITEEHAMGVFQKFNVNLSMLINGQLHNFTSDYELKKCQL